MLRTVELAEATLAVREWGERDGRPLLFLHSLGPAASAAFVGLVAGPLVARGLRLVAPDQPGFGRSPALPADRYAVPALAALAWELADVLELERPIVAGHSWGGAVACQMAAERPADARALVLVDSGHVDYADLPPYFRSELTLDAHVEQAEAGRLRVADREALEAELEIDDPARRARLADALLEAMVVDEDGGLVSATTGAARGAAMHHLALARPSETWPALERAGLPTLLVLATEPAEVRELNQRAVERFRPAFPSAEIVTVEGATHSLVSDLEDRFGELVGAWLERRGLV
ncbi:MAG TPA: alpha/beta hydrolase [Gaiellaceae bacterium]|nr:alpha/beta hydrolase [Gaiellaceae bacterium]